jgi:hypothetical protein
LYEGKQTLLAANKSAANADLTDDNYHRRKEGNPGQDLHVKLSSPSDLAMQGPETEWDFGHTGTG